MTVTVHHGDMRDVLPQLRRDGRPFDCVIVDPPYGQTSLDWDRRVEGWPRRVADMVRSSGSMWVFGSLRLFMETASQFEDWRLSHDVVWEKHNGAGFATDRFRNVHEIAGHFYLRGARWDQVYKLPQTTPGAIARSVRRRPREKDITGAHGASDYRSEEGGALLMRSVVPLRSEHGRGDHPTQKPEHLIELMLRYSCPPGGGCARSLRR